MNAALAQLLAGMGAEGAGGAGPQPLARLTAGKMHADRDGGSYRLRADPRRGELRVARGSDGLVHLTWRDRTTGGTEDDFIVMPGDLAFR